MNGTTYLSVKALHVIAVIAWYAGLFYIFRLYVYHVQKRGEPAARQLFDDVRAVWGSI